MKNEELLKKAKEALDRAISEKRNNQELIRSIGPAIVETLKPVLNEIASNSKITKQDLIETLSKIKIDIPKIDVPKPEVDVRIPEIKEPNITIPEIKIPEIKIPEIKIPKIATPKVPKPEVTVNVPKITIPDLKWPKGKQSIEGWVQLMGVDLNNPLPVQLRDHNGNPVNMPDVVGGGSGGGPVRSEVSIKKPKSVKMFNVEMAVGDTEYSQQLPEGTRAMTMQNREDNDIRISYEASKVATSTAAFMTVKAGQSYYETNVDLSSKTVYVASTRTGTTEIIAYY